MRSLFGKLDARSSRSKNPACAIATNTANNNTNSAVAATLALNTLDTGDRFTLAANLLKCLEAGVYRLNFLVQGNLSGAGTGFFAYRLNGGAEVNIAQITNTTFQPVVIETLVRLAPNDTLELRFWAAGGVTVFANTYRLALEQLSTYYA